MTHSFNLTNPAVGEQRNSNDSDPLMCVQHHAMCWAMKRGKHPAISTQPHATRSYQVSLEKVIAAQHLSIFVTSAHLPIELSNQPAQLACTGGVTTVRVKRQSYYIVIRQALQHCQQDGDRC